MVGGGRWKVEICKGRSGKGGDYGDLPSTGACVFISAPVI